MTPPSNNAAAPHIETVEARLDGRISSMEATFAAFVQLMDERHRASEARMDRMEAMIAEIRASVASLRVTIVITGISSVLAATFGIAALNANMQSNMLAALTGGKEMQALYMEVKQQTDENRRLVGEARQQAEATAELAKEIRRQADATNALILQAQSKRTTPANADRGSKPARGK
ncbi:hypothetical protein GJ699_15040 [Duganella sp. FT80W]|uniref:Uncharacterized protein n=1 Tax=Duganella guangzhouensis TaxID=2666084 RepID=A0A6I2L224_9BURK|nr:hypothetical protein [Duganella guangzhouensis]MRW91307.1 hypothetical protein [Duganella guangzhouensis]